jgi:hypothetical protein
MNRFWDSKLTGAPPLLSWVVRRRGSWVLGLPNKCSLCDSDGGSRVFRRGGSSFTDEVVRSASLKVVWAVAVSRKAGPNQALHWTAWQVLLSSLLASLVGGCYTGGQ